MFRFNHRLAPNAKPEQKTEQSNQSPTPGGTSWKKALAISALPLALLFGAAFQSSNSVPGQLQAIQSQLSGLESQNSALQVLVASLANKGARKFYVTKTFHQGNEALSACAPGYHMASMWEIHDPTYLRYDTVLGATRDDSGGGAPNHFGWIRTGTDVTPSSNFGFANCHAWTTANSEVRGTVVAPIGVWENPPKTISPWTYSDGPIFCSQGQRVWCVQD